MDIRLISFDLDGTFLDDGKGIPPANLRALERADLLELETDEGGNMLVHIL